MLYRGAPPPPLKLAIELPGRGGWEQLRWYTYELSPNEKPGLVVTAQRHGNAWAVIIQDVSDATRGKRSAQFSLIGQSLRPATYEPESFAGKTANLLDAARLRKLDDLVELGLAELGVPGAAVSIVQGGRVVHARGYGVRQLGQYAPVDVDTLFAIASNTKALTTLLLAQLVDDGKLRWDEPVTEAYPGFRLGDAATTAATQIEHLVCACTGLPRKDLEVNFEFARRTPQTEIAALAQMQPTTKFGETFQYSNQLAAAAGFIAGHVAAPGRELGKSYDEAVQARIFGPLVMKHSTLDIARALRGNHAAPHALDIDGKMAEVDMAVNYDVVPLRPAGGAWSSRQRADPVRAPRARSRGRAKRSAHRLREEPARTPPALFPSGRVSHVRDGSRHRKQLRLQVFAETSLDLRYNSGLHISANGRELALLLSELVRVYPRSIDQIALVGHSMGGLVARSAAHYAEEQAAPWLAQLTHVLSIGAPHFGAPLARAGHVVSSVVGLFDTAATQVSAKVLRARSAGIKDLSFGAVLDDDWLGRDAEASLFSAQQSVPFVPGVAYGYVAARFRPTGAGRFGELLGDLLVQLPSASGQHRDPARHMPFHMGDVIEGAHHVALTTHPDVYRQLERFPTECHPPSGKLPDQPR